MYLEMCKGDWWYVNLCCAQSYPCWVGSRKWDNFWFIGDYSDITSNLHGNLFFNFGEE